MTSGDTKRPPEVQADGAELLIWLYLKTFLRKTVGDGYCPDTPVKSWSTGVNSRQVREGNNETSIKRQQRQGLSPTANNHQQPQDDQRQQHQRTPEVNMPNLTTPKHKPSPCSSLGHPQEADQVLSKHARVSWGLTGGSSHPEPIGLTQKHLTAQEARTALPPSTATARGPAPRK